MIEDGTHLAVIEGHKNEVIAMIGEFNRRMNGITSKAEVTQSRLEFIAAMRELLRQHERALRFMRGEPYEKETQFAEAVLVGVVGGGM